MKTTSALVTSRSSRVGKLALAGWWMHALAFACGLTLLSWAALQERPPSQLWSMFSLLLPEEFLSEDESPGVVLAAASAVMLWGLLIIFLSQMRWNKEAQTRVFADRIELTLNHRLLLSVDWRAVVHRETEPFDVWLHIPKPWVGWSDLIAFQTLEKTVLLSRSLSPLGCMAAPYVNQTELRRAFLLALLRARPELRISADVYTLCEVHPATLAHDSKQKWFFRLGMAMLVASACYVLMWLTAKMAAMWAIAGALSTMAAGAILLASAQVRLFIAPEHPRAVALRRSALAADDEQDRAR